MTFKEKFKELHKEVEERWDKYSKADTEISQNFGFVDRKKLDDLKAFYRDWQIAANEYHNFLSLFGKSGKTPADEYTV